MAMQPGFERLKLAHGDSNGKVLAFVLFDSVRSCEQAIHDLNGTYLPCSPYQAVSCQFARNSLNKRSHV